MLEEVKFKLETPIEYTKDDRIEKCEELILVPFNIRDHKRQTIELRQMFFRALNGIRRQSSDSEESSSSSDMSLTPEAVIMALNTSESVNIVDFYEKAESLMCDGVVKLDKATTMTTALLQQMQDNDYESFEMLVGTYMSNFLMPSWMKRLQKN